MSTRIPITKPLFDIDEEKAVLEPIRSGWVVQGPMVAEFERRVAEHAGVSHAVATTSCTTSLHLALIAAGVGPGDEVILPSFTWISTANMVEYVGAKPVFCDIDLETYNIDASAIEPLITPNTKAILPVHLFGLCADMHPILDIAERRGLEVIEDAACAIDSWHDGRHAGSFGLAGCFSFHPRKVITTGEGGMLITNDDRVADLARKTRDHGAAISDLSRHTAAGGFLQPAFDLLGFNYRMTDLQGAIGVAQMGKLNAIQTRRRKLAARYDEALSTIPWIQRPVVPDLCRHGYQAYVCRFGPSEIDLADYTTLNERRNAWMSRMEQRGVSTRQGTHAVHALGYYKSNYGYAESDFPKSMAADRLSVALPLYPAMTGAEQDIVLETMVDCYKD